jgi:hypothetical protein
VATAAPLDELLAPVEPSEAWAAVRTALFAADEEDDEPEDDALELEAPSTVTLGLILTALLTRMVGFAAGMLDVFDWLSASELRLGIAAGLIMAGPVRGWGAETEPAPIAVVCEPAGWAPDVLNQIWFRIDGRCQYCGAISITT